MQQSNLEIHAGSRQASTAQKRKGKLAIAVFLGVWMILIGGGVFGAKWYIDRMQTNITADIERQTTAQLQQLQSSYDESLKKLEQQHTEEMNALKGKVDALNELLTFAKDNADTKTDNSNKLYTQLNEVKKQLTELKKNLDVLK